MFNIGTLYYAENRVIKMIVYDPFWKTMKERGLTTYQLINRHGYAAIQSTACAITKEFPPPSSMNSASFSAAGARIFCSFFRKRRKINGAFEALRLFLMEPSRFVPPTASAVPEFSPVCCANHSGRSPKSARPSPPRPRIHPRSSAA